MLDFNPMGEYPVDSNPFDRSTVRGKRNFQYALRFVIIGWLVAFLGYFLMDVGALLVVVMALSMTNYALFKDWISVAVQGALLVFVLTSVMLVAPSYVPEALLAALVGVLLGFVVVALVRQRAKGEAD